MADRTRANTDEDERRAALRSLPAAHRVVDAVASRDGAPARALVVEGVRAALEEARRRMLRAEAVDASEEAIGADALRRAERLRRPLRSVVNATGVVLHTGLGRSVLAPEAVEALVDVASGYAPVELDMASGQRGRRETAPRDLLRILTGAEACCIVNNAAGALLLTIAVFAQGRTVLVSRGELVEIGGSFRLPDILRAGGATLREVGTTNRTRLSDYERALDDEVGLILKVHPSNFRMSGFTLEAPIDELAALAHSRGVPVAHDIGSGALDPAHAQMLPSKEPDARTSIEAGADLVMFSGDKALGGPQCGVIVGSQARIDALLAHPMMRALRVGKLTLAALGATLALHADPESRKRLPTLAALGSPDEVRARARRLASALAGALPEAAPEVVASTAYLGGGASPAEGMASAAVRLPAPAGREADLAAALRTGEPPIIPRVHEGAVLLDLRTVFPHQDDLVVEAAARAWRTIAGREGRR